MVLSMSLKTEEMSLTEKTDYNYLILLIIIFCTVQLVVGAFPEASWESLDKIPQSSVSVDVGTGLTDHNQLSFHAFQQSLGQCNPSRLTKNRSQMGISTLPESRHQHTKIILLEVGFLKHFSEIRPLLLHSLPFIDSLFSRCSMKICDHSGGIIQFLGEKRITSPSDTRLLRKIPLRVLLRKGIYYGIICSSWSIR